MALSRVLLLASLGAAAGTSVTAATGEACEASGESDEMSALATRPARIHLEAEGRSRCDKYYKHLLSHPCCEQDDHKNEKCHVPTEVFINELHYTDSGADEGEFIEIVGPKGVCVEGWKLVLYNGHRNVRDVYDEIALSGTFHCQVDGYGALSFAHPGIQNGNADGDGIALVDAKGKVVEFICYGGSFTAEGGPAQGLTCTDIGVSESGQQAAGTSLQITGNVGAYPEWVADVTESPGEINAGQYFIPRPDFPKHTRINEFHYGGDEKEFIEVIGRCGLDLDMSLIVFYGGADGKPYRTLRLSGKIPCKGHHQKYGVLAFDAEGLRDGAPDGLAFVSPSGRLIEFLSYGGGTFTAVGGPADGITSVDVGVKEEDPFPKRKSLQLEGSCPDKWVWAGPKKNSRGELNEGQVDDKSDKSDKSDGGSGRRR